MKKEYPKMIYKDGLGNLKGEYIVVQTKEQHMEQMEEWGDKRPDDIAKPEKKSEDKAIQKEAVNSEVTEAKPAPKKKAKKKGKSKK